jgi:hypothetical protein
MGLAVTSFTSIDTKSIDNEMDCFKNKTSLFLIVLVMMASTAATAQEQTADEIARELANPVGSLASLSFQGNYAQWAGSATGSEDQHTSSFLFLPTLPFSLAGGNLVVRPSFPVAATPIVNSEGEWETERGFGDIIILANWGKKEESGLLWSFGFTSIFPTGSGALTSDQYQLGPAVIAGVLKEWGVLGAFWQHWWGLNEPEGSGEKASHGALQLFYWFSVGGGWQLGGSPTPTANYVNATDTDFSFPLNLGVAKTLMMGKMPLKLSFQGQYFVTRPEVFGPSWGFFFSIAPVIRAPW